LVRRQERAVERVALFPNPVSERQLRDLERAIAELDARLAEIEVAA